MDFFSRTKLPLKSFGVVQYKLGVIDYCGGGFDFPMKEGEKYLSIATRGNLALLEKQGIVWERVLFFAVPGRNAWSILVIGKDKLNGTIVYNRRETESEDAGQTKLYYEGRYPVKVSEIIERNDFEEWQNECRKRLKLGE